MIRKMRCIGIKNTDQAVLLKYLKVAIHLALCYLVPAKEHFFFKFVCRSTDDIRTSCLCAYIVTDQ